MFEIDAGAVEAMDPHRHQPDAPARDKAARLLSREIVPNDLPAIAVLLQGGFPDKPLSWFTAVLNSIGRMPIVPAAPRFGYVLVAGDNLVGAVLTLTTRRTSAQASVQLNVACWYVLPRYRTYGSVLYQRLLAIPDVTCVNVTPAQHTWPVIEAQGFRRFAQGSFAGFPIFGRPALRMKVQPATSNADGTISASEQELITLHVREGCVAFFCSTGSDSWPFVFRHRSFRRRLLPAAQLIYCRDLSDVSICAGAIGRHLARHGFLWMVAGTNGPIADIPGRYFPGKLPMYYKGPAVPRPGDVSYTELALLAS